jgi:hypothetical protein
MQSPASNQDIFVRDRRVYVICVCLVFGVALLAFLREAHILRAFYHDTATLAAGTEIRPMGVTFALGITETAAVFFGFCFAGPAVVLSVRWHNWILMCVAILAFVLCLVPMVAGTSAFQHIVKIRGLVLEE